MDNSTRTSNVMFSSEQFLPSYINIELHKNKFVIFFFVCSFKLKDPYSQPWLSGREGLMTLTLPV